jgi:hypothetical protein
MAQFGQKLRFLPQFALDSMLCSSLSISGGNPHIYLPPMRGHLEVEAENASEHSPAPLSPGPILLDGSRTGAGANLVRWRRLGHDARRL